MVPVQLNKISKTCNKCNTETIHRLVVADNYYACSKCTEYNSKKHRINNWYKYLAQKANSRKRPGSDILTGEIIESIAKYQEYKCALTGNILDPKSKWYKPSLDRIDSSRGYIKGNIRIVAWIVNHCRGNLTDSEFIGMCNRVASNFHKYPYIEHCLLKDLD